MASRNHNEDGSTGAGRAKRGEGSPAWADGLKQLYDSVVDEPLPDTFKDLLAQFDESDEGDEGPCETDPAKQKPGSGKAS